MKRLALAAVVSALLAPGLARGGGASADLSVTLNDAAITYVAGKPVTYIIVVANAGPDAAANATVSDPVLGSVVVASASWTCVGANGATCTAGPISGSIVDTVNLPVGGTATYTLTVQTRIGATADLVNVVTVAPGAGTTDPGPGLNTATDTNPAATIFYASPGGADSATCGPLAAPCLTIQKAIDNADAGDAVIVKLGTYNECIVLLPGGGVGGIYVESEEFSISGTVGTTIIDGAGKCDVASGTPGPVAKVYDRSLLRGFAIENGGDSAVQGFGAVTIESNQISTSVTSSVGGGVFLATGLNLSDPFAKAVINANTVKTNTSVGDGAGIYVDASASGVPSLVEIVQNNVTGNTAGDGTAAVMGGGIAVITDTASIADRSTVLISGNLLDGNVAKNATSGATIAHGGGIFVTTGAASGLGTETVTVGTTGNGNVVRNNVCEGIGGGISVSLHPGASGRHSAAVSANNVTANTGKLGGGGMALLLQAIDQPASATPTVALEASGNSLTGNHAQGDLADPAAAGGGGIFAELDSARTPASAISFTIDGNTIQHNDATTHGGGIRVVASADDDPANDGATAPAVAAVSLHNNLIAENAARDATASGASGGGVSAVASARGASAAASVSHTFETVAANQTEIGTGGIQWEDRRIANSLGSLGAASFSLADAIVTVNDGYGVGTAAPLDPATTVTVAYSDAFGNISGNYQAPLLDPTGTNGNISEDPGLDALFLTRTCAATIDAGDPLADFSLEPEPNGGRVNMGHLGGTASATRTFPDVNGDGVVDGLDVLGVAASFGAVSPDPRYVAAADRDLNGQVDGVDLSFVAAFYSQTCP